MANETTNLKLTKPLANEFYDINVFNDNFDKIDKELFDPSVTENTSCATENGVKEFECKNGYVDNIVIEGQTKILNAENIEVEAGTDGAKLVSVGQGDKIEVLTKNSDETKQDKKQILTTLRSLPNGVKDTIEKRGNKYYKIKRCGEVVLNGSESWVLNTNHIEVNTTRFSLLTTLNIKMIVGGILSSDKFTCVSDGITNDKEGIHTKANDGGLGIRIAKTKLSTQDVEGFKAWLTQNPVTVVYELATPIIEELPNFNPQTFSDKTTLLLNSGVVQGEASFEVTNSLGSELEVLKGKVSDLDDTFTIINSHTTPYSTIQYSSLNDIPLKPGRYGIGCKDSSFPTEYGNFTIDYGSYRGEFIGTFRSMTSTNMWISVNRYGDINDRGWKPWQQITTTSTLSALEQQVSELEIQLLENEV